MFWTFYNSANGKLVVIDGGTSGNADHVRDVINAYGGTVEAWFLTHLHEDHAGAFNVIFEDPQNIKIKDVYTTSFPYDKFLEVYQWWDNPDTMAKFVGLSEKANNIHYPKRDDVIEVGGLCFVILNTYDDVLLQTAGEHDLPNNAGMIIRAAGTADSIIFMADTYSPEMGEYLINTYGTSIRSKYLQAPHHGNSVMPMDFYTAMKPQMIMFDAPEWLMNSKEHRAKELKKWCDANGIKTYDFRTAPNVYMFK